MGRDKPKKYSKMGYFEKQDYHDKQAKKYNINKEDFNTAQGGGGGRYDRYDEGAYQKAIKNAMRMADFDYRTSAQHMDGVKGDASFDDYSKYERGAVKLHKQAGNGGQYSSNEDITTVTNNLVQDHRQGIQDQFDSLSQPETEIRDKNPLTQDEPVELSGRAQAAMENPLGEYGFSPEKRGFASDNDLAYDPNAGVKSDKAGSFLNDYKLDIQRGIAKDGTPGRGPNSIHSKF